MFIKQHIMLLSYWLLLFTWHPWIVQRIRIMFQSFFWNYLYGRSLNSSGKNFYILLAICIQATAVHFSFDFPTWDWWMQALVALSATFLLMKHLYALYTITAQRLVYHNQQSIKIFSCDPWGPIKRDLVQRCCVNELHPVWPSILFRTCLKHHLFIFYNF